MIQSIPSNTQIIVTPGEWKENESDLPYKGKYQVGRFTLGYNFMIQYMNIIHGIPINTDNTQDNTNNENAVMHMQHHGIIDNKTLLKMRDMVKKPRNGFFVVRENNVIIGVCRDMNHE